MATRDGNELVEGALEECRKAVAESTAVFTVDKDDLKDFKEKFRPDFTEALKEKQEEGGAKKWKADRTKVTALARAIGSVAEFLAIAEGKESKVRKAHLNLAFNTVKPLCAEKQDRDEPISIRKEYCTTARR